MVVTEEHTETVQVPEKFIAAETCFDPNRNRSVAITVYEDGMCGVRFADGQQDWHAPLPPMMSYDALRGLIGAKESWPNSRVAMELLILDGNGALPGILK